MEVLEAGAVVLAVLLLVPLALALLAALATLWFQLLMVPLLDWTMDFAEDVRRRRWRKTVR